MSPHTELGADCERTPCSSALVALRLCAGYTRHPLPRPLGTAFLAACGCAEPMFSLLNLLGRSFRAFPNTPGAFFLRLVSRWFPGGFIFKTCHSERQQVIRGARLFLGRAVPGWLTALGSQRVWSTKAASVLRAAQPGTLRSWEQENGAALGTEKGSELRGGRCGHLGAKAQEGRKGLQRLGWKQGRFSASFPGFCRYQPLAFEGKYPNQ